MRVVSMVPSWTETLLSCGVQVIARTRFCVHPMEAKQIPVVGGTKDWKWEKIVELKPDLILLDQEENPKFMSEQNQIPWHSTHIESVSDVSPALSELSRIFSNSPLADLSERWRTVSASGRGESVRDWLSLPGVLEWGRAPSASTSIKNVLYMIWKDPWMGVGRNTFIGSLCRLNGVELPFFSEKYPKIDLKNYDPKETLVLFSSEPYPFYAKRKEYLDFEFPHAFVDGESFSWFGIRSLLFLERCLK